MRVDVPKVTVGDFQTTPSMRRLVLEVLDSNRLSYGPMCKAFEKKLSRIHNCDYGVLSNSGTSSLQVALQTLKEIYAWNDGDEVLVPAITFVATVNIILHNRLKPIFVDVEADHYCIDPKLIVEKITSRTRAIIPVHLFGQSANMSEIKNALDLFDFDIKIIEDSCETMFVSHRGQMVGSMGDIGCFSTYIAHLITTGVGGMAVTNNEEYATKMRSLINHGWNRKVRPVDITEFSIDEVKSRYRYSSVGHSYRITELDAALGLPQLEHYEQMIAMRQWNARYLTDGLFVFDSLQLPAEREQSEHGYMMYPIILKWGNKWKLIEYLEKNGIECREMLPLINQSIYSHLVNEEDYPVAELINEQGFYIGCHQFLSNEQLDYIVYVFDSFFSKKANKVNALSRFGSNNG